MALYGFMVYGFMCFYMIFEVFHDNVPYLLLSHLGNIGHLVTLRRMTEQNWFPDAFILIMLFLLGLALSLEDDHLR